MDFSLTEEQIELQKWAHEFAEKEIRPAAAEYDESEEFPWPVVEEAAKHSKSRWPNLPTLVNAPANWLKPNAPYAVCSNTTR